MGYFDLKWPTTMFCLLDSFGNSRQHLQPWACPRGREWGGGRLARRQVDLWELGGFSRPSHCLGTTWRIQQTEVNPTRFLYIIGRYSEMSLWVPNNWYMDKCNFKSSLAKKSLQTCQEGCRSSGWWGQWQDLRRWGTLEQRSRKLLMAHFDMINKYPIICCHYIIMAQCYWLWHL